MEGSWSIRAKDYMAGCGFATAIYSGSRMAGAYLPTLAPNLSGMLGVRNRKLTVGEVGATAMLESIAPCRLQAGVT
jgi:hypothetical protein